MLGHEFQNGEWNPSMGTIQLAHGTTSPQERVLETAHALHNRFLLAIPSILRHNKCLS
jgi:hypothetical protein